MLRIRGFQFPRFTFAARVGIASCGVVAYVRMQWVEFSDMTEDAQVESHLPDPVEARQTHVVRLPRFLSSREIESVHQLHAVCAVSFSVLAFEIARTLSARSQLGRDTANIPFTL